MRPCRTPGALREAGRKAGPYRAPSLPLVAQVRLDADRIKSVESARRAVAWREVVVWRKVNGASRCARRTGRAAATRAIGCGLGLGRFDAVGARQVNDLPY